MTPLGSDGVDLLKYVENDKEFMMTFRTENVWNWMIFQMELTPLIRGLKSFKYIL